MSGFIRICPGGNTGDENDLLAKCLGWIGRNPWNLTELGSWFKRVAIGGTNSGNAPIKAASDGTVTIDGATFKLSLNGATVEIKSQGEGSQNTVVLITDTNGNTTQLNAGGLYSHTPYGSIWVDAGGTIVADASGTSVASFGTNGITLWGNRSVVADHFSAGSNGLRVNGVQVTGARQTLPSNDVAGIITVLRAHGLIS